MAKPFGRSSVSWSHRFGVRRPRAATGRGFLPKARSVATQVFLLQLVIMVLFAAAAGVALVLQTRDSIMDEARQLTWGVAHTFANAPGTLEAMKSADPTELLQPRAEESRKESRVDYVVAFDPNGFRWTHPDPRLIGKHVFAQREGAAADRPITQTYEGSLGLSVDSTVPVYDTGGRTIAGFVSVGITVDSVNEVARDQMPQLLGLAGGGLAVAAGGTALVSRRLRRQTRGLDPSEMTRMYEHHDAVLHAVREGVLIIGGDGRLLLANDEARRLLELPGDAEERPVTDLGLETNTTGLLVSGRTVTDEVHLVGDRLLAVNMRPVDPDGGPAGSVATLRDTTELRALAGRAEVARERLWLLYEAGGRIGTTLNVTRTAQELAEVAVPRFADAATVDLLDPVLRGEESPGPGPEMRRAAVHGDEAARSLYPVGELIRHVPTTPVAVGVRRGQAVLEADLTASDDWRAQDPQRARRVLEHGLHSRITVPLQARGVVLGMASFWRSQEGAFEEDDLAFAEELAARAAVAIDNARRYTREHTLAEGLQRRLLPRALPDHSAVETAHRYLPARDGVGGDWFDVIPLPGARVALVVGDVVGHGLHAAATMGQLRAAVHTFSALDLSPDELLGHLDDLVTRIDSAAESARGDGEGVTGATCLYAVYDPASGVCSLARSGHPEPALVRPDGSVEYVAVPGSPPLGLGGGLPFETAELTLPEGSRLALFTDGLVEDRDRGIDAGLRTLSDALAHPGRTPEETCQAVFDALLPTRPGDDVALLVARTRRLDPSQVAEWEVPNDPASVADVRTEVTRRLRSWGLEDVAFATELVISELVTNAIRYGTDPIRLRLLHDRDSLICEVADGSSTAPHLRRAATTDEGGRGLFLVAQFAQRWGTRYMARGKVIWAEQSVHGPAGEPDGAVADALLDQWDDTGW